MIDNEPTAIRPIILKGGRLSLAWPAALAIGLLIVMATLFTRLAMESSDNQPDTTAVFSSQGFSQGEAGLRRTTLSRDMTERSPQDTVHFITVENMPEPMGGIAALQKNVRYPEIARRAGIEGTVYVEAFIDERGNVVRTGVVKGVHPALDSAATQAVAQTRFNLGKHQGKAVRTRLAIPIRFRVGANRVSEKHTLHPGNYEMSAGAVIVPEKAQWRAFETKEHPKKILLVLEDEWGKDRGFWSVMSYLTPEEAKKLARELQEAAEEVEKK